MSEIIIDEEKYTQTYEIVENFLETLSRQKPSIIIDFDKFWIALLCKEQCIYKHYVYTFGYGLRDYVDLWLELAKSIIEKLNIEETETNILNQKIKLKAKEIELDTEFRKLIHITLIDYFKKHPELCEKHTKFIIPRIEVLDQKIKKILKLISKIEQIQKIGYIHLVDSWIGEILQPIYKKEYREEIELKEIEKAVVEINRIGLIMYCNFVIRDFQKLTTIVHNEYYIPPHIYTIWKEIEKYTQ